MLKPKSKKKIMNSSMVMDRRVHTDPSKTMLGKRANTPSKNEYNKLLPNVKEFLLPSIHRKGTREVRFLALLLDNILI